MKAFLKKRRWQKWNSKRCKSKFKIKTKRQAVLRVNLGADSYLGTSNTSWITLPLGK